MSRLRRLIGEVHRRSLWQVLLIYMGGAWVAFEIVQTLTEGLALPPWFPAFALVLFIIGLPIVIATACVREDATPATSTVEPEAGAADAKAAEALREDMARRHRFLTWRTAAASFVVALAAWGLVAAGWLLFSSGAVPGTGGEGDDVRRPSVAALPFVNLSGREEDAYFTQGIHGEILTRLQKIGGLRVLSRTSVMEYGDSPKNVREIGRELNAGYLLEGEVLRAAEEVRVNVQLIDSRTDEHVWADTYDRALSIENLLDVQSEIAQRIALALRAELTPEERARIQARPTENLDAYQAYLRGRYYMHLPHFTVENLVRAFEEFQRAVELDSTFALVHAELAKAHAQEVYFWVDASQEQRELATLAMERAVRADAESPHVRLALGLHHLWVNRDAQRALEEIARAEEGMPNNPSVFQARAKVYELQGKFQEAIDEYRKALELSPNDATFYTDLIFDYWLIRQYDQAETYADQAINLAPDQMWPNLGKVFTIWSDRGPNEETEAVLERLPPDLGWVIWARYWQRMGEDRYAEAITSLAETGGEWIRLKLWARPKALLAAFAYDAMGRTEQANRLFEEAKLALESEVTAQPDDPRYHSSLGLAYARLGLNEAAVREGFRAVELLPVSRDAVYGLPYVLDLAVIYAMVGDENAALSEIERLLSIPSLVSPAWLDLDFRFDSLRDNPDFQALLEK